MSTTDAIAELRRDHTEIRRLFEKFERTSPGAHKRRRDLVDGMIEALSVHAGVEETVFYPQVRELVPALDDEVLEGLEEHHVAKWTLRELEKVDPEDERFEAKVTVLMESVRHHMREEEEELFTRIRADLPPQELEDIGDAIREMRPMAPTRPHPAMPDTPPANLVTSLVAAPMDIVLRGTATMVRRVTDRITR